ncbi:MAG: outer membrane protein assembly factor BamB [Gammaproteobacteria bacterium]|nr:outer membrane protein assembly factor BamB [Gammaproteobacteria bacterium]
MNKTARLLGLLLVLALSASCGLFSDKDDENTKPKELVDFKPTLKIKRLWSAKVGGDAEFLRVALRPAGDSNRIYAAGYGGAVSAFDPQSGSLIWRTKLEQKLSAGPGIGEGLVVVISTGGSAIALDAASGVERWRTSPEGESLARPVVSDDLVIVQTIDNRLLAYSVFDGRQRWTLEQTTPVLTLRGSASPVVIGSTVISGFDNGRLVAADLDNGNIVWETLLSPPQGRSDLDRLSDIDGAIAAVGQDVYAVGYQGRLGAIAAESGQVLWGREISSFTGASADWNSVYTTRDDGEVIAMARNDGSESWRNDDLLRREPTLPEPFYTTVAVGDFEGYLHFFSNLSGNPVARVKTGGAPVSNPPIVIANRLYVQTDGGDLLAYEAVDERPKRSAPDIASEQS